MIWLRGQEVKVGNVCEGGLYMYYLNKEPYTFPDDKILT